ncbi:MAG TPA: NAD(P)(+) transhydrogenase (Re/Si-specific) subunit beta, partial [Saprospiraceae bacterium]|nr:NAD(P)(+) transhydrogenase (Re/Si-specific) subunit beta [Saprospiraceae bacterium]
MIALCYLLYLLGAIAFILGLRGLSNPKTARRGNLTAAAGMFLAIVASLVYPLESAPENFLWIYGALAVGAILGWISAARVAMTAMPQMVSVFNGLGGGSAMLLAIIEFNNLLQLDLINDLLVFILLFTLFVGAVSFSGSILAYLKLDGKVRDKNISLPWHQILNVFLLAASIASLAYAWYEPSAFSLTLATVLALIYGFSFVAPIGGADMPVVISLLNSITGISAASAGFLYQNQIMILGGILVGSSGTILTILMCNA